jgi:hypothetical protein
MKKDFQDICENESTTMSRKINNFITDEAILNGHRDRNIIRLMLKYRKKEIW